MSEPENPTSAPAANPLDLRFLPSWLKEEGNAPAKYADFDGEDRPSRGGDRRDGGGARRGARPDQRSGGGGGNAGGGRDNRGSQGQRPQGPGQRPAGAPGNGPRPARPPHPNGPARSGGGGRPDQQNRRSGPPDRRQDQRDQRPRPPQPEERPAKVAITFLPEVHALEKVTEQLKSAPIAYPLFAVAKMFLQRPERHHIVIKPLSEVKLFKLSGTSHLSTDRTRLEAIAFQETWKRFFRVEATEAPEIKGNFTSVARSRLSGKVFGPTSHHSYQPAIHKEYEERYSRRMSFAEYKSNIETTNNPEAIELWKTESRRQEVYHLLTPAEIADLAAPKTEAEPVLEKAEEIADVTDSEPINEEAEPVAAEAEQVVDPAPPVEAESAEIKEENAPIEPAEVGEDPIAEPVAVESSASQTFATKAEAEAYFKTEILPTLISEVDSEILTGPEARNLSDRHLSTAVRLGWEAEMRYPLGLVNGIRVKFNEQNLHIFKFKKRVLLISSLKPVWLDDRSESLSTSIRTVLQTIHAQPGINRKGLAEKILGDRVGATEDEKLTLKHSLIGDLYWLVRQGHVIEFSDGTFDLPMGPKAIQAEAAHDAKTNSGAAQAEEILPLAAVDATSEEPQEQ